LSKPPSGRVQAEFHFIPKVNIPWHTVLTDITGKLSGKNEQKECIIVSIDAHTARLATESCIKALKSLILLFGVPSRLIADEGRSCCRTRC